MAKKESEPKLILEREYSVPLRKEWLKVPRYKRSNKAIKALKEFMVRHMKIYDKDLRKTKIDVNLNNEIRFRGVKKPYSKIKVKAKKFDNNIVKVELVNLPKHIEFKNKREERIKDKNIKKEAKEDNVNKKDESEKLKVENKIEENKKGLDSVSDKNEDIKPKRSKSKNKSDAVKKK